MNYTTRNYIRETSVRDVISNAFYPYKKIEYNNLCTFVGLGNFLSERGIKPDIILNTIRAGEVLCTSFSNHYLYNIGSFTGWELSAINTSLKPRR